jgi:hypothetical protein
VFIFCDSFGGGGREWRGVFIGWLCFVVFCCVVLCCVGLASVWRMYVLCSSCINLVYMRVVVLRAYVGGKEGRRSREGRGGNVL